MKSGLMLAVGAMGALGFLAGCCSAVQTNGTPIVSPTPVQLNELTIALTHVDDDGDTAPYCSGVWVDKDRILTADHCARALIEESIVKQLFFDIIDGNPTPSQEDVERLIDLAEQDAELDYITYADFSGVFKTPKVVRKARVLRHDRAHDLALLTTEDSPEHLSAVLVMTTPSIGEDMQVVGHPGGLGWSYTHCTLSAFREVDFKVTKTVGPWVQCAGEVWKGNSGGGLFNDRGELVGIASFITVVPNESFFVHPITLRNFLY